MITIDEIKSIEYLMSSKCVGRPRLYDDNVRAIRMKESQKAYHNTSEKYRDYQANYKLKKYKEKIIDEYDLDEDTIEAIKNASSRYEIRDIIKL